MAAVAVLAHFGGLGNIVIWLMGVTRWGVLARADPCGPGDGLQRFVAPPRGNNNLFGCTLGVYLLFSVFFICM